MANHRKGRVNEETKKALAEIFAHKVRDPRISAMVSVTDVLVTPDLKYAKVYLSIFGTNPEVEKESFEAINDMKGYIRRELSRDLNLRNTPELTFIQDTSIDYGMKMDAKLNETLAKDRANEARRNELAEKEPEDASSKTSDEEL